MSKNSSLQVMQERDMHKVVVGQKIMRVISQFFLYLFLFAIAFIILFPFYWMVISSVKTLDEYLLTIPTLFPREFDFANYAEAFNTANLGRLFGNTVFVGVVSTICALIFDLKTLELSALIDGVWPILYLGIMSSGIAYTLQIVGQKYAEAAVASITMSFESVFAILGGVLISNSALTSNEIIGCVIMFAAIIVAQVPEFKKSKN